MGPGGLELGLGDRPGIEQRHGCGCVGAEDTAWGGVRSEERMRFRAGKPSPEACPPAPTPTKPQEHQEEGEGGPPGGGPTSLNSSSRLCCLRRSIFFTATSRPELRTVAIHTTPVEPSPILMKLSR